MSGKEVNLIVADSKKMFVVDGRDCIEHCRCSDLPKVIEHSPEIVVDCEIDVERFYIRKIDGAYYAFDKDIDKLMSKSLVRCEELERCNAVIDSRCNQLMRESNRKANALRMTEGWLDAAQTRARNGELALQRYKQAGFFDRLRFLFGGKL